MPKESENAASSSASFVRSSRSDTRDTKSKRRARSKTPRHAEFPKSSKSTSSSSSSVSDDAPDQAPKDQTTAADDTPRPRNDKRRRRSRSARPTGVDKPKEEEEIPTEDAAAREGREALNELLDMCFGDSNSDTSDDSDDNSVLSEKDRPLSNEPLSNEPLSNEPLSNEPSQAGMTAKPSPSLMDGFCVICFVRQPTHTIKPCGHKVLCDSFRCLKGITKTYGPEQAPRCPICRCNVECIVDGDETKIDLDFTTTNQGETENQTRKNSWPVFRAFAGVYGSWYLLYRHDPSIVQEVGVFSLFIVFFRELFAYVFFVVMGSILNDFPAIPATLFTVSAFLINCTQRAFPNAPHFLRFWLPFIFASVCVFCCHQALTIITPVYLYTRWFNCADHIYYAMVMARSISVVGDLLEDIFYKFFKADQAGKFWTTIACRYIKGLAIMSYLQSSGHLKFTNNATDTGVGNAFALAGHSEMLPLLPFIFPKAFEGTVVDTVSEQIQNL